MLDSLPDDLLSLIVYNVTDIDALRALTKSCKRLQTLICFTLTNVVINLNVPYQVSLKFLLKLSGMTNLTIFRLYNTKLDLMLLDHCPNLKIVGVNNAARVHNVPSHIKVVVINKTKLSSISESPLRNEPKKNNTLLTPKEYFTNRYNMRYGKYGSKRFSKSF